jgi:hypothetical protein
MGFLLVCNSSKNFARRAAIQIIAKLAAARPTKKHET